MKTETFNINSLVRPSVMALTPYASARDEFKDLKRDMVFLDANENPFNNGVNRYPDPQQTTVKQTLSTLKKIPTDQILLGNGSDEVLDLIIRAFCEPEKDTIITLPPTYGMYGVLANVNNVKNQEISLTIRFQPDEDAILNASDPAAKILFICSPNNPTGNRLDAHKIELILNNFKGLVVIDEAYIDFSKQQSWSQRLAEFPNLIVTQTLSKAYAMAGIRLGICYASAAIIAILNKIKPPYNVNDLTQAKALEQLSNLQDVKTQIALIVSQREQLISSLKSLNFVSEVYPSDANFVLVKVDNATKRYHQLIKEGIVIRNRTTQHLCDNCLRFTIGTPEENTLLLNVLKRLP